MNKTRREIIKCIENNASIIAGDCRLLLASPIRSGQKCLVDQLILDCEAVARQAAELRDLERKRSMASRHHSK